MGRKKKEVIPECLHPLDEAFDQEREDGSGRVDKICGRCGITMCEVLQEAPATEEPPYRPSNGTEGEWFQGQWCERCTKDDLDNEVYCDILTRTAAFSIDDPEYPREWVQNKKGGPRCTAFEPRIADQPPEPDACEGCTASPEECKSALDCPRIDPAEPEEPHGD